MPSTALIFAFNSNFLRAFHAFLLSLRHSPALYALDKVVITTDPAIKLDSAVSESCRLIRLISTDELTEFNSIILNEIDTRDRHAELPKYSMLKWFAFDDYGYERHIYLDVDMLNINSADGILDCTHSDLCYCPKFVKDMKRIPPDGSFHPQEVVGRNLLSFCENYDCRRVLNSGVMVIGNRMLTPRVRKGLIEAASTQAFPSDQAVLRHWFLENKAFTEHLMSPLYNFSADYLTRCDEETRNKLLDRIKFIHFIGKKPWSRPKSKLLWHDRFWLDNELAC